MTKQSNKVPIFGEHDTLQCRATLWQALESLSPEEREEFNQAAEKSLTFLDEALHLFVSNLQPELISACMIQFGPIMQPLLTALFAHNRLPRSQKYFERWTCPFASTTGSNQVSHASLQPYEDLRKEIVRTLKGMSPSECAQYEMLIDEAMYTIVSKFAPERIRAWLNAAGVYGAVMRDLFRNLHQHTQFRRTSEFVGQHLETHPGAN